MNALLGLAILVVTSDGSSPAVTTASVPVAGVEAEPRKSLWKRIGSAVWSREGGAITVATAGFLLASKLPKPDACRWCATNGVDRFFRDHLRSPDPKTSYDTGFTYRDARNYSNVALGLSAFGSAGLLLGAGHEGKSRRVMDIAVMAQTIALTEVVTAGAKLGFARRRPCVSAGSCGSEPGQPYAEENASFPSGHTSGAFSAVFAAARIAHDKDYKGWGRILKAGIPVALACGIGRISGDKHHFTDVVGGALLGATLGWKLPTWTNQSFLKQRDVVILPNVSREGVGLSAQVTF